MDKQKYIAFIDESGISNLNDTSADFLLSMVIIEKKDFSIIEGYLRLLKRKFFQDDYKPLHATDLFEKTQKTYPELKTRKQANGFMHHLMGVFDSVPFDARTFFIDKAAVRNRYSYTPSKGKKPAYINPEMPYIAAAKAAIGDFTRFLVEHDALGEIIVESRLFNDSEVVSAFDEVRKRVGPGGIAQPNYYEVINRITSLLIASKRQQDGGLEVADLCAYISMRVKLGYTTKTKPFIAADTLTKFHTCIKKHAYKGVGDPMKKLLYELNP